MNENGTRWRLWMPLMIVAATVLAYVNAFPNPFIFDDEPIITTNPHIRSLLPVTFAARWLVNLTFQINYAIGELRVADYHAMNLLIHVSAALLLYGWLRRTLMLPRLAPVWAGHSTVLAGAVAALWAVHPLQTESVTYICQRYESVMGLCFLATLYAFVRGMQSVGRGTSNAWFGVSVLTCLLGMGTKEVMATAPVVVLLYDCLMGASTARAAWRERWRVHVALWLTLIVFVLMEWQMFGVVAQKGTGVMLSIPPVTYLLTQMQVIPHYLRLSLVPYPLCLDYRWPLVVSWTQVIVPGAALVCLGLMSVVLWVRGRPAAFVGLWFFCILAPTSSFFPVPDLAFEHRMYLPLAAVLASLVLGGYWLLRSRIQSSHRVGAAGVGVVLLLVAGGVAMTHQRNLAYRSALTMWQSVVSLRPNNQRARLNLTSSLLRAGRHQEAEAAGREVVKRLGYCAELRAEDVPEWGRNTFEAVRYSQARHYAIAHNLIGVACIKQGDGEGAERHFGEAVRLLPQFADAQRNLDQVRSEKEKPRRSGAFPTQ